MVVSRRFRANARNSHCGDPLCHSATHEYCHLSILLKCFPSASKYIHVSRVNSNCTTPLSAFFERTIDEHSDHYVRFSKEMRCHAPVVATDFLAKTFC